MLKTVTVKSEAVNRLKARFAWVYRSDVLTPIEEFEAGENVLIATPKGTPIAYGYINPASVITIRVLNFAPQAPETDWIKNRIASAILRRTHLKDKTDAVRLIHSEADDLPGLIVDAYANTLAVQMNSAGIRRYENEILSALKTLLNPSAIVDKSDLHSLNKEGIQIVHRPLFGQAPDRLMIAEHGVKFEVNLLSGQKTGFYLDQRQNRLEVAELLPQNAAFLDCFCHHGGFGLYAAVKKGAKATLIDSSADAIEGAKAGAKLNGVETECYAANVFDWLRANPERRFDAIVLDPPPFAKNLAAKAGADRGMKDLIVNALKLLNPGGLLAVFSCSHHQGLSDLARLSAEAAADQKMALEGLKMLRQDVDHPWLLNLPQSLYLTGLLLRKR